MTQRAVTLTAQIVNAPPDATGSYTWAAEGAELKQGEEWVKEAATLSGGGSSSIMVRFPESQPAATVSVELTADGEGLSARRPDPNGAYHEYVPDDAVFAVTGVSITQLPEYALSGFDFNLKDENNVLQAEAVNLAQGGTFNWSVAPALGGTFASQSDDDAVSTVTFTGGDAGAVTITATYTANQTGTDGARTLTVYALDMDLKRGPDHDWVSVGESVTFTATVSGDPGTPADKDDDREFDDGLVEWQVYDTAMQPLPGEEFKGEGRTFEVELDEIEYIIEATLYAGEPDPEEGGGSTQGGGGGDPDPDPDATRQQNAQGVRLYIDGWDGEPVEEPGVPEGGEEGGETASAAAAASAATGPDRVGVGEEIIISAVVTKEMAGHDWDYHWVGSDAARFKSPQWQPGDPLEDKWLEYGSVEFEEAFKDYNTVVVKFVTRTSGDATHFVDVHAVNGAETQLQTRRRGPERSWVSDQAQFKVEFEVEIKSIQAVYGTDPAAQVEQMHLGYDRLQVKYKIASPSSPTVACMEVLDSSGAVVYEDSSISKVTSQTRIAEWTGTQNRPDEDPQPWPNRPFVSTTAGPFTVRLTVKKGSIKSVAEEQAPAVIAKAVVAEAADQSDVVTAVTSHLEAMGYTVTSLPNVTRDQLFASLDKGLVFCFYGHGVGGENFHSIAVRRGTVHWDHISAAMIAQMSQAQNRELKYRFVFLSTCWSALNNTGGFMNAFGATAYAGFLGEMEGAWEPWRIAPAFFSALRSGETLAEAESYVKGEPEELHLKGTYNLRQFGDTSLVPDLSQ